MDVPSVQCDQSTVRAQDDGTTIAYAGAGDYRVTAPGHLPFFAKTLHTADMFLQFLSAPVLLLEEETESRRAERLAERVDRLIAQAFGGLH